MNLHEYQGKQLLKRYNVPTPEGIVIEDIAQVEEAVKILVKQTGTEKWVIKAQIHAGGRGKSGGVKIANNIAEVKTYAEAILGMQLITPQTGPQGKTVRKILIEQNIYYPGEFQTQELYFAIMTDRTEKKNVIIYSPCGGMSIEEVAEKTPELIFKEYIVPGSDIEDSQCRKISENLGLTDRALNNIIKFVPALYEAYLKTDSVLLEINPVIKTSDNKIIAADCKIIIDDNALFRHADIIEMRDINEEEPAELVAKRHGLNYIKLEGNVGCMVNGAGLAMATMDIIKLSGGEPANFLDIGGRADSERVENAFRIILQDSNVKVVFVNIFGGIVRCDMVAKGIVEAYKKLNAKNIPVIIRLQGTNEKQAKEIIDKSGIRVFSAVTLKEAVDLIQKVLNRYESNCSM